MVAPLFDSSEESTNVDVMDADLAVNHDFDTDDDMEEFEQTEDLSPFHVDWLDLSSVGFSSQLVGISAMPGCKYMHINRNLTHDINSLVQQGIKDVFVLCTAGETVRCRVPEIFDQYRNVGITAHHYPMEDISELDFKTCLNMLQKLTDCVTQQKKTIIHCVAGVGRSCLVAALLLLELDSQEHEETAMQKLKDLRGSQAIQTIKQFNFINEYRTKKDEFQFQPVIESPPRSVSR